MVNRKTLQVGLVEISHRSGGADAQLCTYLVCVRTINSNFQIQIKKGATIFWEPRILRNLTEFKKIRARKYEAFELRVILQSLYRPSFSHLTPSTDPEKTALAMASQGGSAATGTSRKRTLSKSKSVVESDEDEGTEVRRCFFFSPLSSTQVPASRTGPRLHSAHFKAPL